jgi:hypothetical protein
LGGAGLFYQLIFCRLLKIDEKFRKLSIPATPREIFEAILSQNLEKFKSRKLKKFENSKSRKKLHFGFKI